jgi:hypothetical protein
MVQNRLIVWPRDTPRGILEDSTHYPTHREELRATPVPEWPFVFGYFTSHFGVSRQGLEP